MKNPLDAYTLKARLVPAMIAGAPAFAFAAIFVSWGKIGLPHAIAGTALTVLFAAFADVARRRGKAIEPGLVERMGGLPTTTTVRHRDTSTYDDDTKAALTAFIAAKLGKAAPTRAEEAADPEAADRFYARGATWLRENTRSAKKFDILLNENISYGFRRNLLGLKLPGFLLNAAIVAICAAILWHRAPIDWSNGFNGKLLAVIVIAVLHAVYLALFVTEAGVFEAARTYARQLWLCTQSPHLGGAPKPSPTTSRKSSRPRTSGKVAASKSTAEVEKLS